MFIIPCKYTNHSPIIRCVESINKFHPTEKIVVVDSFSDDLSYQNVLSNYKNITILKKQNNNRVAGAMWKTFEEYPEEENYILMHDSVVLKKTIENNFLNKIFCTFMYFPEIVPVQDPAGFNFYKKCFLNTKYDIPKSCSYINGCFGSMFIANNKIIKTFVKNNLNLTLNPISKLECQIAERAFGICAEQEGISLEENNIEGNFVEKKNDVLADRL